MDGQLRTLVEVTEPRLRQISEAESVLPALPGAGLANKFSAT